MTRVRGELPEPEEALLGIERPTQEQEDEEKRAADEKAEIRRLFLRHALESDLFREWLMEVLNSFRTFEQPFGISPGGFPDPLATQFQMGLKAAGWHLWTMFDDTAPELTSLMRREASKKA